MSFSNNIKKIKLYNIISLYIISLFFVFACSNKKYRNPKQNKLEINNKKAGIEDEDPDIEIKKAQTKAGISTIKNLEEMLDDIEKKEKDLRGKEKNIKKQEKIKEEQVSELETEKEKLKKERKNIEKRIADEKNLLASKAQKVKEKEQIKEKEEIEEIGEIGEIKKKTHKNIEVNEAEVKAAKKKFDTISDNVIKEIKNKGGFERVHRLSNDNLRKFIKAFENLNEKYDNIRNEIIAKKLNINVKKPLKKINIELKKLILELNIMLKNPTIGNSPFDALKISKIVLHNVNKLINDISNNDYKEKIINIFEDNLKLHLDLLEDINKLNISIFYLRGHIENKTPIHKKEQLLEEFNKKYFIENSNNIPKVESLINEINKEIKTLINKKTPLLSVHSEFEAIEEDFNDLEFTKNEESDIKVLKGNLQFLDLHPLFGARLSKKLITKELKQLMNIDSKKNSPNNTKEDRRLYKLLKNHISTHKKLIKELKDADPIISYIYIHLDDKKSILEIDIELAKTRLEKKLNKVNLKISNTVLNNKYLNIITNDTLTKEQKQEISDINKETNEIISELENNQKAFEKELNSRIKPKEDKEKQINIIKEENQRQEKLKEDNRKERLKKEKEKEKEQKQQIKQKRTKEEVKKKEKEINSKIEAIKKKKEEFKLLEQQKETISQGKDLDEKIEKLRAEIAEISPPCKKSEYSEDLMKEEEEEEEGEE